MPPLNWTGDGQDDEARVGGGRIYSITFLQDKRRGWCFCTAFHDGKAGFRREILGFARTLRNARLIAQRHVDKFE